MTPREATSAQVKAADPAASTWLSANAGSGKTRVLTDRVARLLLQDVEPQRILCLTYTKAAATEMQNRLFQRLGEWAMMPDAALTQALSELGEVAQLDPAHQARARRLFARAIETPGGLRIQTIHSFCASLLRRFPLEAGVSPNFVELDDRAAKLLRQDILEEMADTAAPDAVRAAALVFRGEDFTALMEEVARHPAGFSGSVPALFDLPDGEGLPRLLADVFLGDEADILAGLLPALAAGGANDSRAFARLTGLDLNAPDLATLERLESVFLYATGQKAGQAKVGSFPTAETRKKIAGLMPRIDRLMERVAGARLRRQTLQAVQKTQAIHDFARVFLPAYAQRKAAQGLLDFDDLIARARLLLSDPSVAAWVLFRLDGGIDHVLVDEAQDTSPDQWRVIELLTAEFTAGEGTRPGGRTLFVVGDKKQSIYSFQGADVAAFDEKQALFQGNFQAARQRFQTLPLEYSFRSSPAILNLVDAALGGLSAQALGDVVSHRACFPDLPGRVDLWPLIEADEEKDDVNFEDPVDLIRESHPVARLADRIAAEIETALAEGVQITTRHGPRPVHAGDFLILVQTRGPLFNEIIRACKARRLPIAGADRLKLGEEMAVKDLVALLSFLATPEDDLSLAAVLRSPLIGVSEAELYRLARGRPGFLWEAMRGLDLPAVALLKDLRDQVDYLRPYDLLERVLVRHDGRRRLIARLGAEAEDAIDELLNQALAYERTAVPSLTGFLSWLEADAVQVKRQADGAGDRIRVMTVHGSKGLEAEIVILPDTADRNPQERNALLTDGAGNVVWKTPSDDSPPLIAALRHQKLAREGEENLRLLYVALTRARCWLIVAGAGKSRKEGTWHKIVSDGMAKLPTAPVADGLRYQWGTWPDNAKRAETALPPQDLGEAWMHLQTERPKKTALSLSPSDLGGAKALPGMGDDSDAAKARGTALHLLLQHLPDHPEPDWDKIATHLTRDLASEVLLQARRLLTTPALRPLFAQGSLAEVALTAPWGTERLLGTIDRLVIEETRILAVDFKSNRTVPKAPSAVPEGILRQMGAYLHMLESLYPGRVIDLAILWTETGALMPLDPDILRAALGRATISGGATLDVEVLRP
ncbi:double-strand break repair helicase AddA [bacterium]|nr:double-strand break repair helicase AddA [bacterium]